MQPISSPNSLIINLAQKKRKKWLRKLSNNDPHFIRNASESGAGSLRRRRAENGAHQE
jgi:hypothetical protein